LLLPVGAKSEKRFLGFLRTVRCICELQNRILIDSVHALKMLSDSACYHVPLFVALPVARTVSNQSTITRLYLVDFLAAHPSSHPSASPRLWSQHRMLVVDNSTVKLLSIRSKPDSEL
jgi:hypothetical protein